MKSLTLGTDLTSLGIRRQLEKSSSDLESTFTRLSTGQRINRASDDPAGLSISTRLNSDKRVFTQGVRNVSDGISAASIADSTIDSLSSLVGRLEELAFQASNGVYTNTQRRALDDEAQALKAEFVRITQSTRFNKQSLFDGSLNRLNIQGGIGNDAVLSLSLGGAIGTGELESVRTLGGLSNPYSVETADINNDGNIDLITDEYSTGTVGVFLGNGDGTFQAYRSNALQGGLVNTQGVVVGDYNGDGVWDLGAVEWYYGNYQIFIGIGNGDFEAPVVYDDALSTELIASGDFNGDGYDDIGSAQISGTTINVDLNNGDGTLSFAVALTASTGISQILAKDVNDDGVDDLLATSATGVNIFLATGAGGFESARFFASSAFPSTPEVADVNGDGNVDIIAGEGAAGSLKVLFGNGDGTFAAPNSHTVGGSTVRGVQVGDFNGDGHRDVITSDLTDNTVTVMLNDGKGNFSKSYTASTSGGTQPLSLAGGDFNNDGVFDVVAQGFTGGSLSVFLSETVDGIAPIGDFSLRTRNKAKEALSMFSLKRELLAKQRGVIGSVQSRLAVASNALGSLALNYGEAQSRIEDVDVAEETSKLTATQIRQQISVALLAQAGNSYSLSLDLLR